MERYVVIDEPKGAAGDVWTDVFETPEEANKHAEGSWEVLTKAERKNRHIFAAKVTENDLADYAVNEDGVIDWECFEQCDTFPGAFDSDKIGG